MWTIFEITLTAVLLGVSLAFYSVAIVLAILFCLGIYPRPRDDQPETHSLQSLDLHVLPRQPPAVHYGTPVPSRRTSTLDEYPRFHRGNQENLPREVQVSVQEGSDGATAGARLPFIQLSPDPSHHSSAGNTPRPVRPTPPVTAAELARYLVRLGLGEAGPRGSPVTEQPTIRCPRPSITDSPTASELSLLWANANLPYTAFFPRRGNPYRAREPASTNQCTEPPAAPVPSLAPELNRYAEPGYWDQPVQITEQPPTPPRGSSPEFEPRTAESRSRLTIPRRRVVVESTGTGGGRPESQRADESSTSSDETPQDQYAREQRGAYREYDGRRGSRPSVGLNARFETVYYSADSSVASTEILPDAEHINGVPGGRSHSPSPAPTTRDPDSPAPDHAADNL